MLIEFDSVRLARESHAQWTAALSSIGVTADTDADVCTASASVSADGHLHLRVAVSRGHFVSADVPWEQWLLSGARQ